MLLKQQILISQISEVLECRMILMAICGVHIYLICRQVPSCYICLKQKNFISLSVFLRVCCFIYSFLFVLCFVSLLLHLCIFDFYLFCLRQYLTVSKALTLNSKKYTYFFSHTKIQTYNFSKISSTEIQMYNFTIPRL